MRNFVLAVLLMLAAVSPAFAGGHSSKVINNYHTTNVTNVSNTDESARNQFGAKLDAPNLVRLSENGYVGVEGGHNFNGTSSNEGYFVYGKYTYTGNWFDARKK